MTASSAVASPTRSSLSERLLRRAVLNRLRGLTRGCLTVIDAEGERTFGHQTERCSLHATLQIHDPNLYWRVATRGSVGFGESYMAGEWSCDDLTALVRIFLSNQTVTNQVETGLARLTEPLRRAYRLLRRNTRRGSRANIAAHYDLSNEFYRLFLDDTLMYSCAIFPTPQSTLYEASVAKIERICQKLQLKPQDHLLEIGTGWGGFALHAAKHYGCRVTTTTISRKQYELTEARVRQAGLHDRVQVLFEDYRDLKGQYDKLVSIEMIEAVGYRHFNTFFSTCSRLLKPEGVMLLQAITIADQKYEQVKRAVDFIQRHIFPGGCLPSVTAICTSLTQATDMRIYHLEDIGTHYVTTLRRWRERFFANLDRVRALGFSDSFIRMWEFYFCYCEGGFAERTIGDVQILLIKPQCRRPTLS